MAEPIILASASMARAGLLKAAGIAFSIEPADIDETRIKSGLREARQPAMACALALAAEKARHVSVRHPEALVIGADQILIAGDEWFDKPKSLAESRAQLQSLRDPDIFPNINRADSAVTIYPPFAELIFLAVTRVSESVTAMKAAMVGFEIVAFALLVSLLVAEGLPAGRVAVYAWHPLALWEFAGSGHIDAALVALVVAGLWAARRGRNVLTGLFLAGATLTKLYPAVLLPAFFRRWRWATPLVFGAAIIVCYLPFIGVGWRVFGFLPGYAGEEGFDAGGAGFYLLSLLRHLPPLAALTGDAYLTAAAAILLALAVTIVLTRNDPRSSFPAAAVLATAFTILVSPHYPWYFAWLIVFACFIRAIALLWLTTVCLLLYLVPVGFHIVRDDYRLAVESIIYGPFAVLAAIDLWYHHRRATRSS